MKHIHLAVLTVCLTGTLAAKAPAAPSSKPAGSTTARASRPAASSPATKPADAAAPADVPQPAAPQPTAAELRSVQSSLQTLRSMIELYKIQHNNLAPAPDHLDVVLVGKTTANDVAATSPDGTLGPYLLAMPANPLNNQTGVSTKPGANVGWVYTTDGKTYELKAVSKDGTDVLNF